MSTESGRVTRKVTFTVDTPAGVPDSELAGFFAGMWADAPLMIGWWASLPEVTGGDDTTALGGTQPTEDENHG